MMLNCPPFLDIDITHQCNFKCIFCSTNATKSYKKELSIVDFTKIAKEVSEKTCFEVALLGGEPLIREDFLDIAQLFVNSKTFVSTSTNGWFVTKELSKRMRGVGFKNIQVSIDSPIPSVHDKLRGVRGAFDKAVNAVKTLKEYDNNVFIATVVQKENYKDIPKIAILAEKLGVSLILNPLYDIGRARGKQMALSDNEWEGLYDDIKQFKNTKPPKSFGWFIKNKKRICTAGLDRVFIDANGNAYPCELFRDQKSFYLGNIKRKTLESIYNHTNMQKLRNVIKGQYAYKFKECKDCDKFSYCNGGCHALSYLDKKNIFTKDPRCSLWCI